MEYWNVGNGPRPPNTSTLHYSTAPPSITPFQKAKRRSEHSERLLKIQRLLRAEDGIFGGLGDLEFDDAFGWDLDLLTGGGIAAEACGAVFQFEFAEAREREGVLGVLVSELRQFIEVLDRLFFGDTGFFSQRGSDL